MKRYISLLLSLVFILTLTPVAFATNSPPYSLPYTTGITGIRYVDYDETEDLVTENYTISQRTMEIYDVFDLWIAQNWSWSATVQPFRNAFIAAGFTETISQDNYGETTYDYTQTDSANNINMFFIKSQKTAQSIYNDSATVLIEHGVMTLITPQNTPQQPAPAEPTSPGVDRTVTAQQAADALYKMGLFSGTGTDASGNPVFDLDRAPTRHEAITMLIRLLGKTNEAENGIWSIPFTDVANWAKPYVGYAYANGLTSGISATTFSGNDNVSATQYLTLVLRALGYESGTDFQWDKAWELSDKIGLTDGQYNANTTSFTRGDVAVISNNALYIRCKNSSSLLRDILLDKSQPSIKNNIPEEACTSLKAATIKTQIAYKVIIKCVDDATNAETTSEWAGRLAEAFQWIGNFNDYLAEVCQSCGDYDDTQGIKQSAIKLYDAIQSIPTAPNSAEGVFTEKQLNYIQQVIAVFANQPSLWNDYNNVISKRKIEQNLFPYDRIEKEGE